MTALEVRTLAPLMAIRALPGIVRHPRQFANRGRKRLRESRARPLLEEFLDLGFIELDRAPAVELVFGAIGRFWRLSDNEPVPVADADEFTAFDRPGFVKGALNFTVAPAQGGCELATVTRVVATSDDARRSFARYWRLIEPGSALIRRSWLAAIRRCAERDIRRT